MLTPAPLRFSSGLKQEKQIHSFLCLPEKHIPPSLCLRLGLKNYVFITWPDSGPCSYKHCVPFSFFVQEQKDYVPFVLTFTYPFITQQIFIKRNHMPSPLLVGTDKEMKKYSFSQQGPLNLIGQTAMHAANCNITLNVFFASLPTLSPTVCAYRTLPTGPLHSTSAAYT